MRGYLIWLIVALACSSRAQDPAKGSASVDAKDAPKEPAKYIAKDASREPAKAPAKDPAKDPAKGLVKGPAKDDSKNVPKEPAKDPAKGALKDDSKEPAKDPAKGLAKDLAKDHSKKDLANDYQHLKSKLKDIIEDIKQTKKWMRYLEELGDRFETFTANMVKESPQRYATLLNLKVQLAKTNVMLERQELVQEHCLDSVKTQLRIRRIAKERVDREPVELGPNDKKELQKELRELRSSLNEPWEITRKT